MARDPCSAYRSCCWLAGSITGPGIQNLILVGPHPLGPLHQGHLRTSFELFERESWRRRVIGTSSLRIMFQHPLPNLAHHHRPGHLDRARDRSIGPELPGPRAADDPHRTMLADGRAYLNNACGWALPACHHADGPRLQLT